jgi:hypothetical protein
MDLQTSPTYDIPHTTTPTLKQSATGFTYWYHDDDQHDQAPAVNWFNEQVENRLFNKKMSTTGTVPKRPRHHE